MNLEVNAAFLLKSCFVLEEELQLLLQQTFTVCEQLYTLRINCVESVDDTEYENTYLWSCEITCLIDKHISSDLIIEKLLEQEYIIEAHLEEWKEEKIIGKKIIKKNSNLKKVLSSVLYPWEKALCINDSKQLKSTIEHGDWLDSLLARQKLLEQVDTDRFIKQLEQIEADWENVQQIFYDQKTIIAKIACLDLSDIKGLSEQEQRKLKQQIQYVFYILSIQLNNSNSVREQFYAKRELTKAIKKLFAFFNLNHVSCVTPNNKLLSKYFEKQYALYKDKNLSLQEAEQQALLLDRDLRKNIGRIPEELLLLEDHLFKQLEQIKSNQKRKLKAKINILNARKKQLVDFDYTPVKQSVKNWNQLKTRARQALFVKGIFKEGIVHYNRHFDAQHTYSAKYILYNDYDNMRKKLSPSTIKQLDWVLKELTFNVELFEEKIEDEEYFSKLVIQPVLEKMKFATEEEKAVIGEWLKVNKFQYKIAHNINYQDNKKLHFTGNIISQEEDILLDNIISRGAVLQNNSNIILPTYNSWGNLTPGGAYYLQTEEFCLKYTPHYFPRQETFKRKKKKLIVKTEKLTFDYLIKIGEKEAQDIKDLIVTSQVTDGIKNYSVSERTKNLEKNPSFVSSLSEFIHNNPQLDLEETFAWKNSNYYLPNYRDEEDISQITSFYYQGKFYNKSSLTFETIKAKEYGYLDKLVNKEIAFDIYPDMNENLPESYIQTVKRAEEIGYSGDKPFFMLHSIFKKEPYLFQDIIEVVDEYEDIYFQDGPKSETGRLEIIANNETVAIKTLQQIEAIDTEIPIVPKGALAELEKTVQNKVAYDCVEEPVIFPPDSAIIHALSVSEEDDCVNILESIDSLGGLLSIQLRRQHNLSVSGLSPAGDIISGLDMGVPTSLVSDVSPYDSSVFFLMKPSLVERKDIWFTDQDFGGGFDRENKYNDYAQKLGARNYQDSVPIKGKQQHLDDFKEGDMSSSNEIYVKDGINISDIHTVFVHSDILTKINKEHPHLQNSYKFVAFTSNADYLDKLKSIRVRESYRLS